MPYFDAEGADEVCVGFRVSLTGKPKVKTRKNDKHRLYGLWRVEQAREAGYVIAVEGESDTHVGWHHGESVIGVPGAASFRSEWAAELEGIAKIYAIVEPDEGAKPSGGVSPPLLSRTVSTGSTSTVSRTSEISTGRIPRRSRIDCTTP